MRPPGEDGPWPAQSHETFHDLVRAGAHDGTAIFDFVDEKPYTHGFFALRTTESHMEIRNLRVYRP